MGLKFFLRDRQSTCEGQYPLSLYIIAGLWSHRTDLDPAMPAHPTSIHFDWRFDPGVIVVVDNTHCEGFGNDRERKTRVC